MPRASSERPARRLEAILAALRRNGVRRFKALKLDGVGEGLEWSFQPVTLSQAPTQRISTIARTSVDPDLVNRPVPGEPIDELALVAEGREGPVADVNGVS